MSTYKDEFEERLEKEEKAYLKRRREIADNKLIEAMKFHEKMQRFEYEINKERNPEEQAKLEKIREEAIQRHKELEGEFSVDLDKVDEEFSKLKDSIMKERAKFGTKVQSEAQNLIYHIQSIITEVEKSGIKNSDEEIAQAKQVCIELENIKSTQNYQELQTKIQDSKNLYSKLENLIEKEKVELATKAQNLIDSLVSLIAELDKLDKEKHTKDIEQAQKLCVELQQIKDAQNYKELKTKLIAANTSLTKLQNLIKEDKERSTLGDGIPDDWKINGFTIDNNIIVKWNEKQHSKKGYTKYFSDPNDAYPCGDPYHYIEKVLGKCSGLEEIKNPLVAAFPLVSVELDEIIISQNITTSTEDQSGISTNKSTTIAKATNSSHSNSKNTQDSASVKATVGITGGSVEASVSHSVSNTFSSTNTVNNSSTDSSSLTSNENHANTTSLNDAEAAFLNANVRYINLGTAPIYNLKPTLNFAIPKYNEGTKVDTIATISAKSNTVANIISPGEKYPNISQNAISWNTSDDFNSQPIKLNNDQAKRIINGMPLIVETTQISGEYEVKSDTVKHLQSDIARWEFVMPSIYRKTASITLKLDNGEIHYRRVAANKFKSNERKIPQLTIKEALEIAFSGLKFNKNNESISFKNRTIDTKNLKVTYDLITNFILGEQKNNIQDKKEISIFDLFLTQEMNIIIEDVKETKTNSLKKDAKSWIELLIAPKTTLNLKNFVSLEDIVELNNEKMSLVVKEHLINGGMPLELAQQLDIKIKSEDTNNTDSSYNSYLQYIVENNEVNLTFKTNNTIIADNIVVKFSEYAIRDKSTLSLFKKVFFSEHKEWAISLDMKELIHEDTILGKGFYRLKEILKTHWVHKDNFPHWFIDKISIEFAVFSDKALEEKILTLKDIDTLKPYKDVKPDKGIKADKNTYSLLADFKYNSDGDSSIFDNRRIFVKNLREDITNSIIPEGFPKGFENWFADAITEKENLSYSKMLELTKIFKIVDEQ